MQTKIARGMYETFSVDMHNTHMTIIKAWQ